MSQGPKNVLAASSAAFDWSHFENSYIPESLNDLLEYRVLRTPDAIFANWFERGQSLTYRQLDERATRLASSLNALGVRKTCHVAALMDCGPEVFYLWFALLRIGAVLVPINNKYTHAEIAYVVNDSDAQFLIVSDALLEVAREAEPEFDGSRGIAVIPTGDDGAAGQTLRNLINEGDETFCGPHDVLPADVANIQYTSGTTGFPKGCLLTHEFYTLFAKAGAYLRFPDSSMTRALNWSPLFYIDGQTMSLMSILAGATLYFPNRMRASRFQQWLKEHRINVCTLPERVARQIMEEGQVSDLVLRYANAFNWHSDVRRYFVEESGISTRNGYGMTEIGLTLATPPDAPLRAMTPTVGVNGPFRDVRILRKDGTEVEPGETGMLWVRGRALFLGYYRKCRTNAHVFNGDWFRTGDLFRQDEHGYYHIVGRTKEMIKRAGENVSAREVEAVVKSVAGVEDAIVVAAPDFDRVEEVFAIVRTELAVAQKDDLADRIFQKCAEELASFKNPRYLRFVTDLPYTPTGKIKRGAVLEMVDELLQQAYDRTLQPANT